MTKKRKRKRYTDVLKAEVLRAVETRGQRTMGEVAASLGVSESLIHVWKNKLGEEAAQGDRNEPLEQEVRRLRRETTPSRRAPRSTVDDAVARYVDSFYNPTRRHSTVGYVSPLRYEQHAALAA